MRLFATFVGITIISALSTSSADLCKCVDSDDFMGCSCCIEAPLIKRGCARVHAYFPKFEVTASLESNGKTVFNNTFGPAHSNICLPTPPPRPCIGLTHIYTKNHYLELCAVFSAQIPFVHKFKFKLPCIVVDHGKPSVIRNEYKQ